MSVDGDVLLFVADGEVTHEKMVFIIGKLRGVHLPVGIAHGDS